jgi:hypothetical protein
LDAKIAKAELDALRIKLEQVSTSDKESIAKLDALNAQMAQVEIDRIRKQAELDDQIAHMCQDELNARITRSIQADLYAKNHMADRKARELQISNDVRAELAARKARAAWVKAPSNPNDVVTQQNPSASVAFHKAATNYKIGVIPMM